MGNFENPRILMERISMCATAASSFLKTELFLVGPLFDIHCFVESIT
jgi:hypothetical protein